MVAGNICFLLLGCWKCSHCFCLVAEPSVKIIVATRKNLLATLDLTYLSGLISVFALV